MAQGIAGVGARLDPPIIARPGDTVTIEAGAFWTAFIAGYSTLPGET